MSLGRVHASQVRALVDLLPDMDVVPGDPFNSHPTDAKMMGPDCLRRLKAGETLPSGRMRTPLVELPLGATEDRICGTIDIEKALQDGIKAYEPGLLVSLHDCSCTLQCRAGHHPSLHFQWGVDMLCFDSKRAFKTDLAPCAW